VPDLDIDRLLSWAKRLGLFALARVLTRGRLRILCYHGVWIGPAPHHGDRLFLSAGKFERRMALLAEGGYRILPLSQAVELLAANRVGARDVVITIDDAWKGTELHMLPVLERYRFASTLYVPTSSVLNAQPVLPVLIGYLVALAQSQGTCDPLVRLLPDPSPPGAVNLPDRMLKWLDSMASWAEQLPALRRVGQVIGIDVDALIATGAFSLMSPPALQRALRSGVDVQLHTHHHTMHEMQAAQVRNEIETNRSSLSGMLGMDPSSFIHFCYPSGEHDASIFPVLRECGVQTATTTEFGMAGPRSKLLALPRILDGESISTLEFEARLSGFWSIVGGMRQFLGRRKSFGH
jgi:peptidoglycan/xylan/chitin deacetylase (PgdA/CDA1 family)